MGLVGFLEVWEIVESVTYVPSISPIVGAPGLDLETWDSTTLDRCY
jgi:hypothetical protein